MKIFNLTYKKVRIHESTLTQIIKKGKLFLAESTNTQRITNEIRKSPF